MNAVANTPDLLALVKAWESELDVLKDAHGLAARFYEKLHWRLGLPAVIVTAVLGAFVWTESNPWTKMIDSNLIAGLLSIVVLVLNAAQTFLKTDERSNRHKNAHDRYEGLLRELQRVVAAGASQEELGAFTADLQTRWNKISIEAPILRNAIFRKVAG